MTLHSFQIGTPYYANPAMQEHPQKIVVPIGRYGREIQVATIGSIEVMEVCIFDDREFAKGNFELGCYTMSAAVPACASEAAHICAILGKGASKINF